MSVPYRILRPLLFAAGPERAHALAAAALKWGLVPGSSAIKDKALQVQLWGLQFPNPVGLAAGFDKSANYLDALLRLGFGFVEVGSITPRAQPGNPLPRLFRLMEDHALINRMGFNNDGLGQAHARLVNRQHRLGIVGVNLGASRSSADPVADYVTGIETLNDVADYLVINVSSPNTPGLTALQSKNRLDALLRRLAETRVTLETPSPMLLKIAPDLADEELAAVAELAMSWSIDGLIMTNTTVTRPNLRSQNSREEGGLSGRPLFDLSTRRLAYVYRQTQGKLPLIGVGGIWSAESAWEKFRAGASLVALYTGLIYEGPGLVARINRGLLARLKEARADSIGSIVGSGLSDWL